VCRTRYVNRRRCRLVRRCHTRYRTHRRCRVVTRRVRYCHR
jgi:hypothetical protein